MSLGHRENIFCYALNFVEGRGGVNLVWQQCSMMAEEAVVIFLEALSAKFIQIIVNRLVFGHILSCSLCSKVVRDFYVTELKV